MECKLLIKRAICTELEDAEDLDKLEWRYHCMTEMLMKSS
jgi:hypothetical protein